MVRRQPQALSVRRGSRSTAPAAAKFAARLSVVLLLATGWSGILCTRLGAAPVNDALSAAETLYADLVDDGGIVAAIGAGALKDFQGRDSAWWQQRYRRQRRELTAMLAALPDRRLPVDDARAVHIMRASLTSGLPDNPLAAAYGEAPVSGRCADATRRDLGTDALREDLNACFATLGNHLPFEGHTVSRDSAITLLGQLSEPARRKDLFLAFVPLWEAVNGRDEPDSPYRRRIHAAAAEARVHGSGIDAAGADLGLTGAEVEQWLVRILETWRDVTPPTPVEPWDYRYVAGAADRALSQAINRAGLLPTVEHYYRDLGLDLQAIGVQFDLAPRPGKAPVTYANYVTMGRQDGAAWRPTRSRISANFSDGGLYVLNMLVHESAHALHFDAIHNRPAFMDIGDNLFCESFADVTSWNVYDPVWQQKYLGESVSEDVGLRSLYTMVTLESAWALFELRMLREPDASPNALWTGITHEYFHVIAHPEFAWWAQRVQLVKHPGFMANYGLGAAVTADLRQQIRHSLGSFDAGDPQWYPWVAQHLLHTGLQFETGELLRQFLGRPVSVEPLLQDMRRLTTPAGQKPVPGRL